MQTQRHESIQAMILQTLSCVTMKIVNPLVRPGWKTVPLEQVSAAAQPQFSTQVWRIL